MLFTLTFNTHPTTTFGNELVSGWPCGWGSLQWPRRGLVVIWQHIIGQKAGYTGSRIPLFSLNIYSLILEQTLEEIKIILQTKKSKNFRAISLEVQRYICTTVIWQVHYLIFKHIFKNFMLKINKLSPPVPWHIEASFQRLRFLGGKQGKGYNPEIRNQETSCAVMALSISVHQKSNWN